MTLVRLDQSGSVATVTLDRPERRNALSLEMMTELESTMATLGDDRTVRTVVVAGSGPVFSAGHDLGELAARDGDLHHRIFVQCVSLMKTIHRIPQPVIAKVHGPATAAGCQLVAACDLAVAAHEAWFATPGVDIGLFCSTPMVPLTRAIGRKRALRMLLTAERIDAATAEAWGLVNTAVSADQLDTTVETLTERIAGSSPRIVALGKATFYRQIELTEGDAYDHTCDVMVANAGMADAEEGISAFLGKRTPQWPGDTAPPEHK